MSRAKAFLCLTPSLLVSFVMTSHYCASSSLLPAHKINAWYFGTTIEDGLSGCPRTGIHPSFRQLTTGLSVNKTHCSPSVRRQKVWRTRPKRLGKIEYKVNGYIANLSPKDQFPNARASGSWSQQSKRNIWAPFVGMIPFSFSRVCNSLWRHFMLMYPEQLKEMLCYSKSPGIIHPTKKVTM